MLHAPSRGNRGTPCRATATPGYGLPLRFVDVTSALNDETFKVNFDSAALAAEPTFTIAAASPSMVTPCALARRINSTISAGLATTPTVSCAYPKTLCAATNFVAFPFAVPLTLPASTRSASA